MGLHGRVLALCGGEHLTHDGLGPVRPLNARALNHSHQDRSPQIMRKRPCKRPVKRPNRRPSSRRYNYIRYGFTSSP